MNEASARAKETDQIKQIERRAKKKRLVVNVLVAKDEVQATLEPIEIVNIGATCIHIKSKLKRTKKNTIFVRLCVDRFLLNTTTVTIDTIDNCYKRKKRELMCE